MLCDRLGVEDFSAKLLDQVKQLDCPIPDVVEKSLSISPVSDEQGLWSSVNLFISLVGLSASLSCRGWSVLFFDIVSGRSPMLQKNLTYVERV